MNRYRRIIEFMKQREEARLMRFYRSCEELGKKGKPIAHEIGAMEQAMGSGFKFELRQVVAITASGERGEVMARAEYATSENSYLLRYKAADGRAVEAWWAESALAHG